MSKFLIHPWFNCKIILERSMSRAVESGVNSPLFDARLKFASFERLEEKLIHKLVLTAATRQIRPSNRLLFDMRRILSSSPI